MTKAKARKEEEPERLYPINIPEVKKLLRTLREKETDEKLRESIDCLEWIFDNIYGNVLVCKGKTPLGHPPDGPCCGMC